MAEKFKYSEDVTGEIINVPVEMLNHHPLNPRKDYGDLDELVESVKAKGILQNLTIVPYRFESTGERGESIKDREKAGYAVVIGNRRLEAAKRAGLETLPCIFADMTAEEEVATMLLENMQRTDLTIYEQAQGFQMMFDFGNDIDTIVEKTGFSKTTVRRRLKLTELDQEKLKAAATRQFTLDDLDKLNQIDCVEKRNELLADIGTSNYRYRVQEAINEQKRNVNLAKLEKECVKRGFIKLAKVDYNKHIYIYGFGKNEVDKIEERTKDVDKVFYAFNSYGEGSINLYKERGSVNTEADNERARINAEREKARKELDAAHDTAAKLRKEFVIAYSNTNAKKNLKMIADFLAYGFFLPRTWDDFDAELYIDALGVELGEDDDITYNAVKDKTTASPEKAMLCMAYARVEDDRQDYYDYNGMFDSNARLDKLYEFLTALGYEMSDEEKALQDGTSPLYLPADEDEDDEEDDEDYDEVRD